jgi:hypothetical protein
MSITPVSELVKRMQFKCEVEEKKKQAIEERQQKQYLYLVENFNKFIQTADIPGYFIGTDNQGDQYVWNKLRSQLETDGYKVGNLGWVNDFQGDFVNACIPIYGVQTYENEENKIVILQFISCDDGSYSNYKISASSIDNLEELKKAESPQPFCRLTERLYGKNWHKKGNNNATLEILPNERVICLLSVRYN